MFCQCDVHLSHTEVAQPCKQHEGWGCLDTKQETNERKPNKTCMALCLPPAECLSVWIFVCELRRSLCPPRSHQTGSAYLVIKYQKKGKKRDQIQVINIIFFLISEISAGWALISE